MPKPRDVQNAGALTGAEFIPVDTGVDEAFHTTPSAIKTYINAEPAKGADDNYVTDAEKIKLANLSGVNTGDQDLSGYSLTSHNHSGTYQPAGTYSTDIHSNITALNAVSGTNTGDQDLSAYSLTNHNHSGVYQPAGTYSTDIHSNITALNAVSGTNTGDQDLTGLLDETAHDLLDHTGLTGIIALGTTSTTAAAGDHSHTLNELSDVSLGATPADGDVLSYELATGLWKNKVASGGASDHESLTGLQGGTTGEHVHLTNYEYNWMYGQMPAHTEPFPAVLNKTTPSISNPATVPAYLCLLYPDPPNGFLYEITDTFTDGDLIRIYQPGNGLIIKCLGQIGVAGLQVDVLDEAAALDAINGYPLYTRIFATSTQMSYYKFPEDSGWYIEIRKSGSSWLATEMNFLEWMQGYIAWDKVSKTGALPSDIGAAATYHAHQAGIERDEVTNLLPAITSGTSTLTVASGSVWMYDEDDMDSLTLHTIATSGELWSSLGTDVPSFVCADRDTNTWVVLHSGTTPTTFDYVRYVPYFIANKRSGSTHLHNQINVMLAHGEVEAIHKTKTDCGRYDRAEGALLNLSCADTTLLLGLSGGRVYATYYPYDVPALSSATDQFKCVLSSGVWSYTRQTGGATLANAEYNGAAGMVTMTDGKYALLYVWRGIENEDHVYTYYSTAEYDSLALANAAGLEANIPPLASGHAMFVGRIPFLKGQTTGFTGYSAFTTAFAAATAITVHNSLSGLNVGDYQHLTAAQKTALIGGVSADGQHTHGRTTETIRNETGVAIAAMRAVYVTGFNNVPLVALADNTDSLKHHPIGVTTAAINHQADGTIVTNGLLTGVNTNGFTAVGSKLYLSTAGTLTETMPTSGEVIFMGEVMVKDSLGTILLYHDRGVDYVSAASGQSVHVRMGDSAGATKIVFEDYTDTEVASINSDGAAVFSGVTSGGQAVVVTTDSRLTDARTPTAHNQAESTITFSDITTGNATTGQHGYLPKLGGGTSNFLRADGTWAAPAGGPGGGGDGGFSFKYAFDTTTTGSPATGNIQLNNATPSSATLMYIYETDATGAAIDVQLDEFDVGDWIMLSNADRSVFHVYLVNDQFVSGASIDNLPVAWQYGTGNGATNFSNAETIYLSLTRREFRYTIGRIIPLANASYCL